MLLVLACSEPVPPPSAPAVGAPSSVAPFSSLPDGVAQPDGVVVLAKTAAGPLSWNPLLVEGQAYGDGPPFGTVLDMAGQPLAFGSRGTCNAPDANALLQQHGKTWLLTHLECAPGGIQVSELAAVDDAWAVRSSRPADPGGAPLLNKLCAGQATAWGTMLGAQEFETDAALWQDGAVHGLRSGLLRYRDDSHYDEWAAGFPTPPSPYENGWMHETAIVDATGATTTARRFAMGRFSHELGRVMPDGRTVYLSDDTSYGILAMFVADAPGALDSGRLYVSRWTRLADDGTATLQWIDLGHARDADIAAALDRGVGFGELFDRMVAAPWGCPDGSTPVRAPQGADECLVLRAGQEALASRLETRRAAALAGATVELDKEEGLALDAAGRRLFVAFAHVGDGMLAGDPKHADHLALSPNPCGMVMSLGLETGVADRAGVAIDSDWVATTAVPVVEGIPQPGGGCDGASISGPDNLDFVPGHGVLLIAEDSHRAPNLLWAWKDGTLLPLLAAPGRDDQGMAEVSGLAWVPDLGGRGFITVSLQHPGERPAVVGLLGPIPDAVSGGN